MPKFESLRPVGVMAGTLSLQVTDSGSNPVLVHFQSSCACLELSQSDTILRHKFIQDSKKENE